MTIQRFERWTTTVVDSRPQLSVVVPAYNEERRILPTLGAIASYCCDAYQSFEVVVADDGSTDETARVVRELQWANLRLLSASRQGKGAAVGRGMRAARGAVVLFCDADLSTPIEQLGRLHEALIIRRADVAIGSRSARGADVHGRSWSRRALSMTTAACAERMLALGVHDTQCGFKLFRADAARALFTRQRIPGFAFDLEILYLAHRLGLLVVEVPVEWHDAPGSKVSAWRDTWRGARDLRRIRRSGRRGVYDVRTASPAR